MRVITTAKVIIAAEKACTDAIQPGNQEWVTVIKSVNSTSWVLLLMVIFKG
jgi:hypothetical protein